MSEIGFIDEKTKQAYYGLAKGRGDEKKLYELILKSFLKPMTLVIG